MAPNLSPEPHTEPPRAQTTATSLFSIHTQAAPSFRSSVQPPRLDPARERRDRRKARRRWLARLALVVATLVVIDASSRWWIPWVWTLGLLTGASQLVELPRLPERLREAATPVLSRGLHELCQGVTSAASPLSERRV
jgi:hypothetical protein